MITLEEAVELALEDTPKSLSLYEYAIDYGDQYEFRYAFNGPEDLVSIPSIAIRKKDGKVGIFFPPDYSREYLKSGKKVSIKKYLDKLTNKQ